ncbi:MAG: transposase [Elusimicrobia bacterium]|nr:transposase [Elusimicrobiota bacterium]
MARPLRIEYPGALYHITSRGNARQKIYLDDQDRLCFQKILNETINHFNWYCFAYCLMDNHYHLLIETPVPNLSRGMRQLNGIYTQNFNHRYQRIGHLFQGRFKAILVEKNTYLLELCRYIVLNPVRAHMVQYPGDWAWSSFKATAGLENSPLFLTIDPILAYFNNEKTHAEQRYMEFVLQGIGLSLWDKLKNSIYLGSDSFLQSLRNEKKDFMARSSEIPKIQTLPQREPLSKILQKGTSEEIALAFQQGYLQREIGNHLGIHYTTVSRRIRKTKKENTALKGKT